MNATPDQPSTPPAGQEPELREETLRDLLQSEMDKRGWGNRRMSRETERVGRTVSHVTIGRILNGEQATASVEVADAFAAALGIPQERVYAAASAVVDTSGPVLLSLHKSLSEDERELALEMYRTYVRTLKKQRKTE